MTPFVGRNKELKILIDGMNAAKSGNGRMYFIAGETGVGKTRLIEEFAKICEESGVRTITVKCVTEKYVPYFPIKQILEKLTDIKYDTLDTLPLGLTVTTGDVSAELDRLKEATRTRTMILERFLRFFEKITEKETVFVALDDIQLADSGTLSFIHYLSRNIAHMHMLFAGTYPLEHALENSPVINTIRNINIERNCTILKLEPFNIDETGKLVYAIMNTWKVPEKAIGEIYEKTGGLPLYIEELCRAIVGQESVQDFYEFLKFGELEIPAHIKNLILLRVDKLDEDAKQVLRWCAVLGKTFNYRILKEICALEETQLLDAIEHLMAEGYIREIPNEDEVYSFTHTAIIDAVYSKILTPRRKLMHKRAGELIEKHFGSDVKYGGEIGKHYIASGDFEKGFRYFLNAAENALNNYAMEDCIQMLDEMERILPEITKGLEDDIAHNDMLKRYYLLNGNCKSCISDFDGAIASYENALRLETDVLAKANLTVKIAMNYLSKGMFEKALAILTEMSEKIPENAYLERSNVLGCMGMCYEKIGDFTRAVDYYAKSLELCKRLDNEIALASAYHRMGTGMCFSGDLKSGKEFLEKALEIRKRHNLKREIAGTYNNLGIIYTYLCDLDKAIECYTAAKKIYEEIGDLSGVSTAYNNIAGIYSMMGNHERAIELAKSDLEISRRTGNKHYEMYALAGIGHEYFEMKEFDRAMENFQKAMELGKEIGEKRMVSSITGQIALMHAMKGNFVEAYKLIEDAISLGRETGFWDVLAELLTGKGTILQIDKKFEEAEDCFLQALQIYRETDAEESAMSVNFELARLYIDMGRKNEAKAILEEVLAYYTKLNIKSMIEKINKELELLSKTNP